VFSDVYIIVENFRSGISSFHHAGVPVRCLLCHFLQAQRNVSLPQPMFMHICKYIFPPPALHGSPVVCVHTIIGSWNHMPYLFKLNSWEASQIPERGRSTPRSASFLSDVNSMLIRRLLLYYWLIILRTFLTFFFMFLKTLRMNLFSPSWVTHANWLCGEAFLEKLLVTWLLKKFRCYVPSYWWGRN
jgi:hypothetical protein